MPAAEVKLERIWALLLTVALSAMATRFFVPASTALIALGVVGLWRVVQHRSYQKRFLYIAIVSVVFWLWQATHLLSSNTGAQDWIYLQRSAVLLSVPLEVEGIFSSGTGREES